MIFGFNMLLEKSVDQILFDASVSQPEKTLPVLLKNMGAAKVSHEKVLTGMDDIGDARIAMSAVVDAAGIPMQVDILMFRRGPIMLFIFSYVLEGQKPNITVHSLGVKADARAQSTLETLH
jgi:hypothetical protein